MLWEAFLLFSPILDQCGPYPRSEECKKNKPLCLELALGINKPVEIRQLRVERITYAFNRVERDAAHRGKAGDGGGLHVDQCGLVGLGQAALFSHVGNPGAGGEPERTGAGVAVEAFACSGVDDAGHIVGFAGLRTRR